MECGVASTTASTPPWCEQAVVALGEAETLLFGERFDFRRHRARRAGHETDGVTVLGRLDKRLAPPAKSDDARFDHALRSRDLFRALN
jgi:hypothetical protein